MCIYIYILYPICYSGTTAEFFESSTIITFIPL